MNERVSRPMLRHAWRVVAVFTLAGLGSMAGAIAAQGPGLAMLDRLQPGLWEVRERGSSAAPRRMCIDHGRRLIQLRHPGEVCQSLTVEDTAVSVTVHYTCPASGSGRTRIRFENATLAQLETQGVANGLPFDSIAEARRVGACP